MRRHDISPHLAATATTLVAMVAMVAGAADMRPGETARAVQAEVVALRGETLAMRAVAAVVAAAARDMLVSGAATGDLMIGAPVALLPPRSAPTRSPRSAAAPAARPLLGPRLLDLPPPAA